MSIPIWLSVALAHGAERPPGITPPVRCGTPAFIDLEVPEPAPVPRADRLESGKATRDAYRVTANVYETDNFVFRWGSGGGVTTAEVERLAEAFEDSWLEQVDLQGHPVPYGADDFLFNVYIGGSGGGTPSDGGAAGYFSSDPEGWPMVVVGASTLDDPDYADITAAHEFYHAIQGATGRYSYSGDSAWFWEASATWASATVYPANFNYAAFLFSYAYLPHYAVNFFDYPTRGELPEYYQYGAFIVPFHLAEITADRALIRDVWTARSPAADPLSMLQELMAERGLSFDAAFLDHAARMATYDYPDGDAYARYVDAYERYYEESSNTVAAEVDPGGTGGQLAGPAGLEPYRYGYNAIRIDIGRASQVAVEVEGDARGSRRSEAQWGARLVVATRSTRSYHDVEFDGQTGSATLTGLDGQTVWLVVVPWTSETRHFDAETFAYRYSVTVGTDDPLEPGDSGAYGSDDTAQPGPAATDTAGEDASDSRSSAAGRASKETSGCGCATVSAGRSSVLWLCVMLLAACRRASPGANATR